MLDGKAKRYELFKMKDDADYEKQLRPHILLDAVHMKGHEGKKLGMILATQDTVLPVKNQRILQNIWQPQKLIVLENDHFWAIIKSWLFYQDEIVDFFVESAR